ncbi:MAG: hypothetical protein EH225_02520 [Calditrichaeota bacterium]|nr:hypothetical protein [Calditrichota bacterium]RQW07033.1 MAG: hypothetical protein EH225_02520 [Calditrichota bacterium]
MAQGSRGSEAQGEESGCRIQEPGASSWKPEVGTRSQKPVTSQQSPVGSWRINGAEAQGSWFKRVKGKDLLVHELSRRDAFGTHRSGVQTGIARINNENYFTEI